ncbi:hypothetical protein T05_13451 [Trichinella murrelli]|uniref:Uncharacterized protein n=1 Tax=Trichinella murrelli TaxID=144512 RepID=A0A0V0T8C1_9BILA|nr:hypothetical protein T05_13451 [Trichinella murrelli]
MPQMVFSDYVFIWILGSGLMTPTTKCLFVDFYKNQTVQQLLSCLHLHLLAVLWPEGIEYENVLLFLLKQHRM